ncbi:MAG: putative DNA modification/repair radical SAM protein [Bacillota bacterium]|nr:putative DNA modification/repair radical SAM protein [Bacillota bacterium]
MDIMDKLQILSAAAKYDVSCSSSGSSRKNMPGGLGNGHQSGICHSFSEDGRCISLLKILFSNDCIFNCAYCVNRSTNDLPRASFTPEEVVQLTMNFYRRNYIEGLFLSSAVVKNPDHTMELMVNTIEKLRLEYRFNGYIHLKVIPGANPSLISKAGLYADRLSVNIELPSNKSLKLLAPQKNTDSILKPMNLIKTGIIQRAEEHKSFRRVPAFAPAGQSTQLIVGATPENDLSILRLSEGLYNRYKLKRVYYSAYVPVSSKSLILPNSAPPLLREHRLYQADWLLRFYGFKADEILNESFQNLDISLDPKSDWALRNPGIFPLEINKADYQMILRIPGIGVKTAQRIVAARRVQKLDYDDLKKMGAVLKRARYFITCKGKYHGGINLDSELVRYGLSASFKLEEANNSNWEQISMFQPVPALSASY